MPTVFKVRGVRYFFFSDEGDPREPLHIHAWGRGAQAKIWLFPEVQIAYSAGFNPREQSELIRIVAAKRDVIVRAWNEHFG